MAEDAPRDPTETSPLLGASQENGTTTHHDTDPETVNGAVPAGEASAEEAVVAQKMHLLLPAIGIGIFLCAVDQLLTVATYAKIGSELKALNNTSWLATSYFITLTCFQPLYGKLSDIFGRKECLLFAYSIFAIGCLGCGLAPTFAHLCAARAVAGIGGGGMNALVSILMSDIVPLRDRGVWQGYINIIFAAGTSAGAPLGGLLADSVGWRWSFLGQVPICALAFAAVYFVLEVPRVDHSHWKEKVAKIDFLGAFLLVIAVIFLLAGLDAGSNKGWGNLWAIVPLALTPVLFSAFVFVEMRIASHPFAPGHIIFNRALFPAYMANFFATGGQFITIFVPPLFFQVVQGASATRSGGLLVPPMLGAVLASLGGGLLIRRTGRYYRLTVAAFSLLLLSVVPLTLSFSKGWTAGVVAGIVLGAIGAGGGITTTLIALLANAATEDVAVTVACSYLFRSLGSSIGASMGTAVLQQVLRTQLSARLGDDAGNIEERVRESVDFIRELPPAVAYQVRESYRLATMSAMIPTTAFLVFGLLATLFIKEVVIHK
ncbi:multidrug resistance protein fnx1 [Plectosphaerella plurivora]|uniref:Multidrug resistance protein fnx1 n=1 Tax=Plectosphaerella plurivora TaxID=936078 RepID=A0A9P8VBU5_9PEZI|nr:multidrug resistance protein fnx1 [Plectosphaerella plurivora]